MKYRIEDKKIGYMVYETEDLEEALEELKSFGRAFVLVDETGKQYKTSKKPVINR